MWEIDIPLSYKKYEVIDIIDCYSDSDEDFEKCRKRYINKYPNRKRPTKSTIHRVVLSYLRAFAPAKFAHKMKADSSTPLQKVGKEVNNTLIANNLFEDNNLLNELGEDTSDDDEVCLSEIKKRQQNEVSTIEKKEITNSFESDTEENLTNDDSIENIDISNKNYLSHDIEGMLKVSLITKSYWDGVDFKTFNSKKRKSNCSSSTPVKKSKTFETIPENNQSRDFIASELVKIHNALVYTTRLDDMSILHKNMNLLRPAHAFKAIMHESKPKYNSHAVKSNKNRKTDSILLEKFLWHLNSKFDSNESNVTKSINLSNYNTDEINLKEINTTCNVVIIIKNLTLKQQEVYVTDSTGTIIEYHCIKTAKNDIINEIDHSKTRLILDICCWYNRKCGISAIWSNNDTSLSKFLRSSHKCIPSSCNCCCKPKEPLNKSPLLIENDVVFGKDSDLDNVDKDLIPKALTYNESTQNTAILNSQLKQSYSYKTRADLSLIVFRQKLRSRKTLRLYRSEYIDLQQKHLLRTFIDPQLYYEHLNQITEIGNQFSQVSAFDDCCKLKRHSALLDFYKHNRITPETLMYLKHSTNPIVCNLCKKKQSIYKDHVEIKSKLSCDISIEHTRKLFNTDCLTYYSYNNNFYTYYFYELTDRRHPKFKRPQVNIPKLSNLVISCEQIPDFIVIVNKLQHDVATAIIKKITAMRFTINEDGNLVMLVNSSLGATSSDEFELLSYMLKLFQSNSRFSSLPTGSDINIISKIEDDETTMIQSGKQNSIILSRTLDNTIQGIHELNVSCNIVSTSADNENQTLRNLWDVPLIPCKATNNENNIPNAIKTETSYSEITQIQNCTTYNVDVSNQTRPPYNQCIILKNRSNSGSNTTTSQHKIDDTKSGNDKYDNFAKLLKCNKEMFANSFKIHLKGEKIKVGDEIKMPIISSVFSIQNSMTKNNENVDSTSKTDNVDPLKLNEQDIYTNTTPSTSNKNVRTEVLVNKNPMLYGLLTKAAQTTHLNSNVNDVCHSNTINNNQEYLINQTNVQKDNLIVLTPISQILNNKSYISPENVSSHLNNALPDLLNDIPKVKEEVDVIIIDSD